MKATTINEKTLELNICEEYLVAIRKEHPKAFWYGPTTREEAQVGYDAGLQNAEGEVLFLQFKRPLRYKGTEEKEFPYLFKVDTRQHQVLRLLALDFPKSVKYAFPYVGDLRELKEAVPNLRSETYFCVLENTPDYAGSEEPNHKVDVYRDCAVFHSEPQDAPGFNGRFLASKFLHARSNSRRVTYSQFESLYEKLVRDAFVVRTEPDGAVIYDTLPRAMFIPV